MDHPLAALLNEHPPHQLSATELRSRIALHEAAVRAYRAELEGRTTLDALPEEMQQVIFGELYDVFDPRAAVAYISASKALREPVQRVGEGASKSPLQQLKEEHAAAAALCLKLGRGARSSVRSCMELREAKEIDSWGSTEDFSATDLATLGKLIPALPALETLSLTGWLGVGCKLDLGQLLRGLDVDALPALTRLSLFNVCEGEPVVSALAAALDRGALPRLEHLHLSEADIDDAALVALAPALRRWPTLEVLEFDANPFGDEGLAALVAPPPADAPPPQAEALAKLRTLDISWSKITDAGCAHLASRLRSGALPALELLELDMTRASAAARAAVYEARPGLDSDRPWNGNLLELQAVL